MLKTTLIAGVAGVCIGVAIGLIPQSIAQSGSPSCGGNGKFQAATERFTEYKSLGVFVVDTCTGAIVTAKRYDYSSLQKE